MDNCKVYFYFSLGIVNASQYETCFSFRSFASAYYYIHYTCIPINGYICSTSATSTGEKVHIFYAWNCSHENCIQIKCGLFEHTNVLLVLNGSLKLLFLDLLLKYFIMLKHNFIIFHYSNDIRALFVTCLEILLTPDEAVSYNNETI